MNVYWRPLCSFLLLAVVFELVTSQDEAFFLKASKNVPRIGKRSKNNNEDPPFEKFFLKASKSVPRIGRRGSPSELVPLQQKDLALKYPLWSDLAELYEYNPELFSSPQLLAKLGEYGMVADDPNAYDWDRIQKKRNNVATSENGELIEYKLQPEMAY